MQTLESINTLVSQVKYRDWKIVITPKGDGFLLQVQFTGEDTDGSGKIELQKSRKWYISPHSVDSEIVRTCFLAIRQAEDHEICERFTYKGQQIYNPHLDMNRMADFISAKPFETRSEPFVPASDSDITVLSSLGTRISDCGIDLFPELRKGMRTRAITMTSIAGIEHIHELVCLSKKQLLKVRNTGAGVLSFWERFLETKNLHFDFDVEKYGFTKNPFTHCYEHKFRC